MRPTAIEVYNRLIILKFVVVHSILTPPKFVINESFSRWSEDEQVKFDEDCKKKVNEVIISSLKEKRLWNYVSPKEKEFLLSYGSKMDEYSRIAAIWRMEAAGMLMWALKIITDWLPIDIELEPELLKKVEVKKIGLFSKRPLLRSKAEIDSKRDLIELWHWRVRTQHLIETGEPFTPTEDMKRAGFNTLDDIVRFSAKTAYERGDLQNMMEEDFVFLGKPFRKLTDKEFQKATSIIMERHYALNWVCGKAPGNRWDETPTDT